MVTELVSPTTTARPSRVPWRRIPIFVAAVVCLVAALWGSLLLNGVGRRTLARSLALASLIGSPVVVLLATALPVS